jgi:D-alanine-D-alanine ligase
LRTSSSSRDATPASDGRAAIDERGGRQLSDSARRVAVLKGGRSLERGVSLRSGAHAHEALARLGHDVRALDADGDVLANLLEDKPDAAFIALHGSDGEDGSIQQLLEAIGIPYTGSGPAACACAHDKALAKHLMSAGGIPTPGFSCLSEALVKQLGGAALLDQIEHSLSFPLVAKPARQGSALGVKFARTRDELPGALVGAFSYDEKVLVERFVAGRDLAVSVLEGQALPVVEAVPREEDFYDFSSRYEIGMTTFVCPAELDAETTERAQELAVSTYELLGCRGVARVDEMLDSATGELWVLECNVVPGMTETSLLPQAADAAGIDFDHLIERVLESAFERVPGS